MPVSSAGLFDDEDEDLFSTSLGVSTDQLKKQQPSGGTTNAAKPPSLFGSPDDLFGNKEEVDLFAPKTTEVKHSIVLRTRISADPTTWLKTVKKYIYIFI